MGLMMELVEAFRRMTGAEVVVWTTLGNVAVFFFTLGVGQLLVTNYQGRPVVDPPAPLTRQEVLLAASCVILNSGITILGIVLWRAGIIQVREDISPAVIVDVVVLFMAMDFAMYVLHRVAHHPLLYPIIHITHHLYENPRPLTLFVLNPFETVSFGLLWIAVITVYHASYLGIFIYLTLNLAFGLMGHLGVEPMPGAWLKLPVLRTISTSTFHAEHHQDKDHNYGSYTLIWDRLFGTLSPEYQSDFGRATALSNR